MNEALEDKKQNGDQDFMVETPMMTIINHHVTIDWWVSRLLQMNYGLKLSKETVLSANRMPWRGVTHQLRLASSTVTLPKALTFSAVRQLAVDDEWDKAKFGNRLDVGHLIVKPWVGIERDADSYLDSFLLDVWMHWFQVWFWLVIFNFMISSNFY